MLCDLLGRHGPKGRKVPWGVTLEAGLPSAFGADNRLGGGQSSAGQLAKSRLVGDRPPTTVLLFPRDWRFLWRPPRVSDTRCARASDRSKIGAWPTRTGRTT